MMKCAQQAIFKLSSTIVNFFVSRRKKKRWIPLLFLLTYNKSFAMALTFACRFLVQPHNQKDPFHWKSLHFQLQHHYFLYLNMYKFGFEPILFHFQYSHDHFRYNYYHHLSSCFHCHPTKCFPFCFLCKITPEDAAENYLLWENLQLFTHLKNTIIPFNKRTSSHAML